MTPAEWYREGQDERDDEDRTMTALSPARYAIVTDSPVSDGTPARYLILDEHTGEVARYHGSPATGHTLARARAIVRALVAPPEVCALCGDPIAHGDPIARHDMLDGNGFGRLNAPMHRECDEQARDCTPFGLYDGED